MWSIVAGGAYFAVSGQWTIVLGIAAAAMLVSIFGAVRRWRSFTFEVGKHEMRINSGLLHRQHRSIPFDRIQDVDISQGPVARLLGVAQLTLETGGGSAGNEDGLLAAVTLHQAEGIRRAIRAGRSGVTAQSATEIAESEVATAPIYAMRFRRLLLAGTFNFSLALFAALAGAFQTFDDFLNINPFKRAFWVNMKVTTGPLADFVLDHRIALAVAGLFLIGLLGLATGLVRTILRDYGFRIDRAPGGLRRRRGLLTKADVTLQLRRIQAAVVGSGPLRSAFGWSELRLQSLAQDEGSRDDHVIAPLASGRETDALLSELCFGEVGQTSGWQRVSRAYLLTFLIATGPLYIVAIGYALFALWAGAALAALIAVLQGMRLLAWRRTSFLLDGDRLLVRRGWWRRRTFILPARNIQSIDLTESFITRWFGTASLLFGVAGGSGHLIPALPREMARQIRGELLSIAA